MTRLLVHVEGKTEEEFVRELLKPHLLTHGYTRVDARGMGSSRQRERRQGVKSWDAVKLSIGRHLKEDQASYATLLVDYYGMPESTWPGRAGAARLALAEKTTHLEKHLYVDFEKDNPQQARRFIPYVLMHEFEALLFSDCHAFAAGIYQSKLLTDLQAIKDTFQSPEHINDSPETAPSKRITALFPRYEKPLHGTLAALAVGLPTMRHECHSFNQWLTRLEAIGNKSK